MCERTCQTRRFSILFIINNGLQKLSDIGLPFSESTTMCILKILETIFPSRPFYLHSNFLATLACSWPSSFQWVPSLVQNRFALGLSRIDVATSHPFSCSLVAKQCGSVFFSANVECAGGFFVSFFGLLSRFNGKTFSRSPERWKYASYSVVLNV